MNPLQVPGSASTLIYGSDLRKLLTAVGCLLLAVTSDAVQSGELQMGQDPLKLQRRKLIFPNFSKAQTVCERSVPW